MDAEEAAAAAVPAAGGKAEEGDGDRDEDGEGERRGGGGGLHRDGLHLDLMQLHDLGRHLRAVRGDVEGVARGHG